MTRDSLWLAKWQEAIDILEINRRNPSKFIPEDRGPGFGRKVIKTGVLDMMFAFLEKCEA